MSKNNVWSEQKQQILNDIDKIRGNITISKLQEKFSISFARANEVYGEYFYLKRKNRLSNDALLKEFEVLKRVLTKQLLMHDFCYVDKEVELLNYESDLINKTKHINRIIIATKIDSYLRGNEIPYYLRGNLTSSYYGYLLHMHNVDTLKYNIKPEICFGTEKERINFSLDFSIPKEYENKEYEILSSLLLEEYVYYLCYKDEDTGEYVLSSYTKVFSNDDKSKEHIVLLNIDGVQYKCLPKDYVKENVDVIEINLISSINEDELCKDIISFDDINKNIEKYKDEFIDEIDRDKILKGETKKNILESIHNSYDLARLYGLLCSTYFDKPLGNPKEEVVFRDDVYSYLLAAGIKKDKAFHAANKIRKGRYPDVKSFLEEEFIDHRMREKYANVMYLFPKGHALAMILVMARKIWNR